MEIRLFKQINGDLIVNDLGNLLLTNDNAPQFNQQNPSGGFILTGLNGQFSIEEILRSNDLRTFFNDADIILTDSEYNIIQNFDDIAYLTRFDYKEAIQINLSEYTTIDSFNNHIYDGNIHFTKESILLSDLFDVDISGAQNGYFLSFNNGIWVPQQVDLSNYYTIDEVDENFLSANTFQTTINTNGINNNGGITATTFYGELDWSYITNTPEFALEDDLQYHINQKGSDNPHEIGFNDLVTTAHTHLKSDITDFNENDYVHKTGDEVIQGNKTFSNNVLVQGDLTVLGSTTTINTTNLNISDNIILLNSGETGSGVSSRYAGISISRGTLDDFYIVFDEIDDKVKIGTNNNYKNLATIINNPANNGVVIYNNNSDTLEATNNITWNNTLLNVNGSISANTIYADIIGNVDWLSITNKPTTIAGYGITDAYTKTEVNQNFLSANTFESTINTNGINNSGGITSTTFYGNINWSYITNAPDFALNSTLQNHINQTGSANPHQIGFNDLVTTAHTHDERYYTNSGGTIYGNVVINGSITLNSGVTVYGISSSVTLQENSNSYISTQAAIRTFISNQTIITFDAARSGNVNAPVDLLRHGVATSTTPFILPKNMTIKAISAASSANATWTAAVLVNNNIVASLTFTNQRKQYSLLNINVNAGDEIRLRVSSVTGTVNSPAITVFLNEN